MKSRPILFSAPMVRALLDGSKTQTRRIIKPQPIAVKNVDTDPIPMCRPPFQSFAMNCPYGAIGDQLWVRETWRTLKVWDHIPPTSLPAYDDPIPVMYLADNSIVHDDQYSTTWGKTRVSIHMPRWASRITLEITDIRVERLQDISPHDALAEGVGHNNMGNPVVDYQNLWDSINAEKCTGEHGYSWAGNPWVWALTFKRITS